MLAYWMIKITDVYYTKYFCLADSGHVPVLHLFIFFVFVFQEKKKRSAEELVEIQELIKTTRERMEEVSSQLHVK